MKTFSSSILSVNESAKADCISLDNFKEKNESYLYKLLQFNENVELADHDSTKSYYKALVDLVNGKSTSPELASKAIFDRFEKIKIYATTMARAINPDIYNDQSDMGIIRSKLSIAINRAKKDSNEAVTMYYIEPENSNIYDETITNAVIELTKYCTKVINDAANDIYTPDDSIVNRCLNITVSRIGTDTVDGIDGAINKIENLYTIASKEVNIQDATKHMEYTFRDMPNNIDYKVLRLFEPGASIVNSIDLLRINSTTTEHLNEIRDIVNSICDTIVGIVLITIKANQIFCDKASKCLQLDLNSICKKFNCNIVDIKLKESMEMHGSFVDSKSMFDDLDIDDFNSTDFMNLNLVDEHAQRLYTLEVEKEAYAMEAVALANRDYNELVAVNEAIVRKIKSGLHKAMEAFKAIISKFVEKLSGNFATEKAYLNKYKNIILNYDVKGGSAVFYCDIISGMANIKRDISLPISYATLREKPDSFKDEETFFNDYYRTKMTGFTRDVNIPLATQCKDYFGAKNSSDTFKKELTFENLNITNCYQWLLDTEKLTAQIRKELKDIDRTVENYLSSAAGYAKKPEQSAADNATQTPANQQQPTAHAESVYSYLLDRYVTEADIKSAADNTQSTDQANTPTDGTTKTNYRMDKGNTNVEVKASGDEASLIERRMGMYLSVSKTVLTSKITAIEYIHKELMSIMRYIVKAKLGNSADIQYKPADKSEAQADK